LIRYIIPTVSNSLKLERHFPYCKRFGGNIHSGINYQAVSDIKNRFDASASNEIPILCYDLRYQSRWNWSLQATQ